MAASRERRAHENPLFDPDRDAVTDAADLQALAHPLRIRLLGLLRRDGASTASRLAERLDVSSGLTSYHLRQLAAAGFIREADRPGSGRERWWQASQRSTHVLSPAADDAEAGAVTTEFLNAVVEVNFANARAYLAEEDRWSPEWREVTSFNDMLLALTPAEADRLQLELARVIAKYPRHESGAELPPGAAVVQAQYQIFPAAGRRP
ncbi:MAG TPA: winged helix-turn-helix domain-containing protein [Jatrophihabitans sp.]|nr:winged helix-turn-helix domain-containing protein [Jatrophihabitans sp.]